MNSQADHAIVALIAAHRAWDTTGDIGTDHEYLQHLAGHLTNRGWIRVHIHDSPEGEQQRNQIADLINTLCVVGEYPPEHVASAVLVALLNPTHTTETETTR